jgi:hypothetical protein
MQPSRILPDLQCAVLCEDVRQEVNGNFILVGVINHIRVPQLPVTALRLCLFTRWTAGVGQFTETVRLVAPDQSTVIRKGEVRFNIQDASHHATNVNAFTQVKFEMQGVHYIEVVVDEVMKLRFPLAVAIVKPPPGTAQDQTAAPSA